MFCRKCGKQIPDDSAFCNFCGESTGATTSSTTSSSSPTPTPTPPPGWHPGTRFIDLTCPKCSASLSINSALSEASCNYCGAKFMIDKNNGYTVRIIDDAAVTQAETERLRLQHQVAMDNAESLRQNGLILLKVMPGFLIGIGILFIFLGCYIEILRILLLFGPLLLLLGLIGLLIQITINKK